ncbi:restriction endonuclease subunit S [Glaesserella parasuis]|uniref:restriction endonuclease subunit S n=1 Tax=Glaesserella parasuis TaxID=738 RepID=UPI002436CED6|nr:restriction endonuclease subunit S [Glaesserella parasuis]MDG6831360.1 restriction endonuclease subunit S [Glaesserella parasuis]
MIESRFIEKLLNGREVEWKHLGDIASYIRGLTYTKNNESPNNEGYKILRANNITLSNNTLNLDDIKIVKFDTKVKENQKLYKNDILISAASGSREHVGKVAFITADLDYYFGGFMGVIRCVNDVNPRYVFHILTSDLFQNYLNEVLNSSTINNLNSKVMEAFFVPIPPLDVQQEIVRILDAFTSLTAELTAELTSRQKQYQYFKEHLLNINNNIVWKSLSEITITTKNIKWENNKKNYRYIDLTSVNRENNRITETIEINAKNAPSRAQKIIEKNDILFATTRPTQQRMTIVPEEYDSQIASTGYCVLRPNKEEVLPEWIYYNISTIDFKNYVEEYQSGSAYPAISDYKVKEYKIPIPSIQMQEKLISILNRFEELTHSIEAGLPNEIQLRKQQYEYYRNMLLNFK